MLDLAMVGGTVVNAEGMCRADVGIENGVITQVCPPHTLGPAKRTIDASGKYIMPGMIDPHVHIGLPFRGQPGSVNAFQGSEICARSGVTTILDFSDSKPGVSLLSKLQERREELADSVIDYGIHPNIVEASDALLKELPRIAQAGCPTIKLFTTYRKAGLMLSDGEIIRVMEAARACGMRPGVHAEDDAMAEYYNDRFQQAGTTQWKYHAMAKPGMAEGLATQRLLAYARMTGCALYIHHLTCIEALEAVRAAKCAGQKVYAETCIQYLELNRTLLEDPEYGFRAICSPPLRDPRDQAALWGGLIDGTLDVVASDNCGYTDAVKLCAQTYDEKGNLLPDYRNVANGINGMGERFALMMTDGVGTGRLSLPQVVALCSTHAAKLFGMYPRKGVIAPGADADIILVDPEKEAMLHAKAPDYGVGYSLYEGRRVKGLPVMTLRRGEVIVEHDQFCAPKGSGRFLIRKLVK